MMLAGIFALAACAGQQTKREQAPVRVTTEVVGQSTQARERNYVGIVEEKDATSVSFTTMGSIKKVYVREGQMVSEGDLLAEMDDTSAKSILEASRASKEQAEDALSRYSRLHDSGSLPEVKWVEIQSKVTQAESQYEIAKKNLDNCRLTAPCSGYIGKKFLNSGETALPSQTVVTILDISEVAIKVSVPEKEIGGISPDSPTSISVEAAGATLKGGRIDKGVIADALTHTYEVRIRTANQGLKLLPGMVANVTFERSAATGTTVPVASIQKKTDGSLFVWTVGDDSRARRRSVRTGAASGNRIAVAEGLAEGERIVTEGWQKLSEGTKVIF